ncbi:MAG: DUF1156 domain-containing protein [Gammaproteobacteria bacterium]|nr:DUF1156 domain-containing protein [Gammaproteobacteria bacterium]MDE0251557.1 DUF1156 domain-containing protein [Gammaproteobacteria bacterium]MDE0403433.1 DUF1156 domain-containing protein [Gammaproteobacteria bacterium]
MLTRPKEDARLIERWLPIAALSEECDRERRSMTALPPTYYLHVWWARRPLILSRAAILASFLPETADREKFMHVLGIHGDPIATRKALDRAKRTGDPLLSSNIYGYQRAFKYTPTADEHNWINSETTLNDLDTVVVLDPTAGGGSIPFEANRLGTNALANDLNPVATLILHATVNWPRINGILEYYQTLTKRFMQLAEMKYENVFPKTDYENLVTSYLWARTISCPFCDGLIPLSPHWRLGPDGIGVRLKPNLQSGPNSSDRTCSFEIVRNTQDQSGRTVARGDAICPFDDCGRVIDGAEVKKQAQAGEMGDQLYAVAIKRPIKTTTKTGKTRVKWVRDYRAPKIEDDNSAEISAMLQNKIPEWEALDYVPTETYNEMFSDRSRIYGVRYWRDLFSPRQLFCHGTSVEIFRELLQEDQASGSLSEVQKAAYGYLAIALDKFLDYNSQKCIWISQRQVIGHTFTKHDFSFAWSYVEMAILTKGGDYEWAFKNVLKCVRELSDLLQPRNVVLSHQAQKHDASNNIQVSCKSADRLDHVASDSVDLVVMDPPYYDNVMYAELSDFFYVWLKRTAGYVYPDLFRRTLTDKDNEAVSNPIRFKGEKSVKELAARDYQERMAAIFAECRRVLKTDGLMTLMFNHKATGAWDALTSGLITAGFRITASWPVNSEAPGSLNIKNKAAARSTILLVCRPRANASREGEEPEYWEDVESKIEDKVRSRVAEFQTSGIRGVDLFLASFGPALEEFSNHWPLTRGTPRDQPNAQQLRIREALGDDAWDPYEVTPEDALVAARREVKRWRLEQITSGDTDLDPSTAFFVFAWDTFSSPVFPFDEALQLARSMGVDLEADIVGRLATKSGPNLTLLDSVTRAAKGFLGSVTGNRGLIDSLHHAANVARTRSVSAATELLSEHNLLQKPDFETALEAVLEVLPPSSQFTNVELDGDLAAASNDFEALYKICRFTKGGEFKEPKQLDLWRDNIKV